MYLDIEGGVATLKGFCSASRAAAAALHTNDNPATVGECSEDGYVLGAGLGYRFNKHFAAEGSVEGVLGGTEIVLNGQTFDVSVISLLLGGRGTLPIGENFFAQAKAGYHFSETEISEGFFKDFTDPLAISETESTNGIYYGIGVGYSFGEGDVRLEYASMKDGHVEGDVDVITAGLVINF